MQIEVKIRGLMMDPNSGTPIIILKDVNSEALLPIWVGAYEANAIALEIEKIAPQRPMTHDLIRNLILQLGAKVSRIIISELKENTFFATIEMVNGIGERISIDSRPSDAIALALRVDAPIFVREDVINLSQSSRSDEEESLDSEEWPDVIGEGSDLPM